MILSSGLRPGSCSRAHTSTPFVRGSCAAQVCARTGFDATMRHWKHCIVPFGEPQPAGSSMAINMTPIVMDLWRIIDKNVSESSTHCVVDFSLRAPAPKLNLLSLVLFCRSGQAHCGAQPGGGRSSRGGISGRERACRGGRCKCCHRLFAGMCFEPCMLCMSCVFRRVDLNQNMPLMQIYRWYTGGGLRATIRCEHGCCMHVRFSNCVTCACCPNVIDLCLAVLIFWPQGSASEDEGQGAINATASDQSGAALAAARLARSLPGSQVGHKEV